MNIEKQSFGQTRNLESVDLFSLSNNNGMCVRIMNYGGIVLSLTAPDRDGIYEDVVLGYDDLESYIKATPYFGAIVGRYGNRIANGKFILNKVEYLLNMNDGENHLHGGNIGFDKVVWAAKTYINENESVLELEYLSKDGEEGYPGNLLVAVKYILTNYDELIIEYSAKTDKPTHICLTNHSYFNLSADLNKKILDHELWLNSKSFLPIDDKSIPIGNVSSVSKTPFDFTKSSKIGLRINEHNEQLINGNGYDHCMVFKESEIELPLQATLYENKSGRFMELFTTEPALQLYTGNYLDGSFLGKGGIIYNQRAGVCLETEHFPDSPNKLNYPSTRLLPGETYSSKTVFKFSTR